MLTTKELKALVGFAEGFQIPNFIDFGTQWLFYIVNDVSYGSLDVNKPYDNILLYDIFLTRCIEGINRTENNIYISLFCRSIDCLHFHDTDWQDTKQTVHDGTTTGIRTAKEECLRWVLEEI